MQVPMVVPFWVKSARMTAQAGLHYRGALGCDAYGSFGGHVVLRACANAPLLLRSGAHITEVNVQLSLLSSRDALIAQCDHLRPDTMACLIASRVDNPNDTPALFAYAVCAESIFHCLICNRDAMVSFWTNARDEPIEIWPERVVEFSGIYVAVDWERLDPPEYVQQLERRFMERSGRASPNR
jgi:hypothetical protein